MFEIDGKNYELKFNLKRIQLIERNIGKSIMSLLVKEDGMLSVDSLCAVFAYALKEVDSDVFVPAGTGREICEKLLTEQGYTILVGEVLGRIQEDCPFLFREG